MPGIKYPGLLRFKWNNLNFNPCVMGPSLSHLIFLWTLVGKETWAFHHYLGLWVPASAELVLWVSHIYPLCLPGSASGKEPACQCRRHKRCEFDPWVRKMPRRLMSTHTSILAWRIPWTEEPDRLHSMELQRVRHDWSDLSHSHTHPLCLHSRCATWLHFFDFP